MTIETVEYHDEEISLSATVRTATLNDGITLADMMAEARKDVDTSDRIYLWRVSVYPTLAACCVDYREGMPFPTFDETMSLPQVFVENWFACVRRINPHWFKTERDEQDLKD